jgi:hypothetical protein
MRRRIRNVLQHLMLQQAGKMGVFNVANELDKWGEGVSDMALQQYFNYIVSRLLQHIDYT